MSSGNSVEERVRHLGGACAMQSGMLSFGKPQNQSAGGHGVRSVKQGPIQ